MSAEVFDYSAYTGCAEELTVEELRSRLRVRVHDLYGQWWAASCALSNGVRGSPFANGSNGGRGSPIANGLLVASARAYWDANLAAQLASAKEMGRAHDAYEATTRQLQHACRRMTPDAWQGIQLQRRYDDRARCARHLPSICPALRCCTCERNTFRLCAPFLQLILWLSKLCVLCACDYAYERDCDSRQIPGSGRPAFVPSSGPQTVCQHFWTFTWCPCLPWRQ
jgi:hypothetical protein